MLLEGLPHLIHWSSDCCMSDVAWGTAWEMACSGSCNLFNCFFCQAATCLCDCCLRDCFMSYVAWGTAWELACFGSCNLFNCFSVWLQHVDVMSFLAPSSYKTLAAITMADSGNLDTSPYRVYIENLMFTVSKATLCNTITLHTGIVDPQIRVIRKQEGRHRICSAIIGGFADAAQMQHVIELLRRVPAIHLAHILAPGTVSMFPKQAYLPGSRQLVRPPPTIPPQPKASHTTPLPSRPSIYMQQQSQPSGFAPNLAPPLLSPPVSIPVQPPVAHSTPKHVPKQPPTPPPVQHRPQPIADTNSVVYCLHII